MSHHKNKRMPWLDAENILEAYEIAMRCGYEDGIPREDNELRRVTLERVVEWAKAKVQA